MPYRLNEYRAKIQFLCPAAFPSLIHKACMATDTVSNTRYIQEAVAEKLARDLDLDLDHVLDTLPAPKGPAAAIFGGDRRPIRRARPRIGR